MNKTELIKEVAKLTKLSQKEVELILNALIDAIIQAVANGEEVNIYGFGKYSRAKRSPRKGRNPQTGIEINIPERFQPKFTAAKAFKEFSVLAIEETAGPTRDFASRAVPKKSLKRELGKKGYKRAALTGDDEFRGTRMASTASEEEDEKRHGFSTVNILYATNRKPDPDSKMGLNYGDARSENDQLHFGECLVTFPTSHEVGEIERPSWTRFEFSLDPKKHVILKKVLSLQEEQFINRVAELVKQSKAKDILILVHGDNTTFHDAALRTAQFSFDLKFNGAPILFSWPSQGKTASYTVDENQSEYSIPFFEQFLTLLGQKSGAEKVHIVAHSMGNRIVCEALRNLSQQWGSETKIPLHHIVLTAPDIDAGVFKQLARVFYSKAKRVTLYASENDRAMKASMFVHKDPRAGQLPPPLIMANVDTIDASSAETDFFGHAYFAENRDVLSDINSFIVSDQVAADRFQLKSVNSEEGVYYSFR